MSQCQEPFIVFSLKVFYIAGEMGIKYNLERAMSINHLKSKVQVLEMQMDLLKKQLEAAAGDKKYKSLQELKGVWKSAHLTTDKELTDVQMVLEKDLL